MSMQDIAAALQRVEAALERRPVMGLHDEAPATARWQGGTRVEAGVRRSPIPTATRNATPLALQIEVE